MANPKDMIQFTDATKLSDGAFFDLIADSSPNREWDVLIEDALTSPERAAKLRTVLTVLAIQMIREQGH
jgi:hypothetical protein